MHWTWFRSLVKELRFQMYRATKPACHIYWALAIYSLWSTKEKPSCNKDRHGKKKKKFNCHLNIILSQVILQILIWLACEILFSPLQPASFIDSDIGHLSGLCLCALSPPIDSARGTAGSKGMWLHELGRSSFRVFHKQQHQFTSHLEHTCVPRMQILSPCW